MPIDAAPAVEPRDAASVIVARDAPVGIELYLLRRHARMAFAPGVAVFPGGAVETGDYHANSASLGRRDWGDLLGVAADRANAIIRAAQRELREETGLRVEPAELHPWSCWVTPEGSPKRFRTWFFLTRLPTSQLPRDVSGEADAEMWLTPRDTLAAGQRQELDLWPPQHATCRELSDVGSVAEAIELAESRVAAGVWPAARFTTDDEHVADVPR